MHVIVVMPCLNEEGSVGDASRSLGFGAPRTLLDATLVLVDNGSTDGTLRVMAEVAAASRQGSVVVVRESERGHVPARSRGAAEARGMARRLGLDEGDVLLAQADADTEYSPGYLDALVKVALGAGPGALVEGLSEEPQHPVSCEAYFRLEREMDRAAEPAFGNMAEDVVVDDKVAAFRLSDYFAWGGHVREYDSDKDEILAETTRLCIRARLRGGFRVRADAAVAVTSQRRTLENPALAFATAGYPRGAKWTSSFRARRELAIGMASFGDPAVASAVRELSLMRAWHVLGLFGLLPAWFSALHGRTAVDRPELDAAYAALLAAAPTHELVSEQPGRLLEWAINRPAEDYARLMDMAAAERLRAP